MSEQFREKIGLDYLFHRGSNEPAQQQASKQVDWAVQVYGVKILEKLKQGTGTTRLLELVELLGTDIWTLKRAAEALAESGLVEISPVNTGNDEIKLTPKGREIPA